MALDYGHVDVVRYLLETDSVDVQATYDLYEGITDLRGRCRRPDTYLTSPFRAWDRCKRTRPARRHGTSLGCTPTSALPGQRTTGPCGHRTDLGNKRGMTPLLMAAKSSSVETVELLLGISNIEPHRGDIYGFTAYHSACDTFQCATGHIECQRTVQIFELLSSHGCRPRPPIAGDAHHCTLRRGTVARASSAISPIRVLRWM